MEQGQIPTRGERETGAPKLATTPEQNPKSLFSPLSPTLGPPLSLASGRNPHVKQSDLDPFQL